MNTLLKVGAASALTLAGVAAHASIANPSTGASDAVLFANVVNAAGTQVIASYAGDTGVSVATIAAGLAAGSSKTYLGSDANLAKLFAADGTGDQVVWGVLGGAYPGSFSGSPGAENLVSTSSANSVFNLKQTNTGALANILGSLSGDIATVNSNSGGTSSVEGPVPATAGVWDYTSPQGASGGYGSFSNGNATGFTANLYDLTGSGTGNGKLATYTVEGTASLSSSGLTLVGPSGGGGGGGSPVPLPAAVWLLGSGLLGLTGVARRKLKTQIPAQPIDQSLTS